MTKPLIFIVGPTGVGKSDAGFLLAQFIDGEIVNADAMSVYQGVDIASDKPSKEVLQQIPHHLFDVVALTENFNVAQYRVLAIAAIEAIIKRGKTPIVVGGSGMYVTVLLDGIFERQARDNNVRDALMAEAKEKGLQVLHARLGTLDPKAAAKIHPNDMRRIVRALEVAMTTGEPISDLQPQRQGLWGQMPIRIFGLNRPREVLYQRVEARVEAMIAKGLVEEIRGLSHLPISQTAGYLIGIPETLGFLKGEYDLEQLKYLMKLHTRHLVKNQLTWFLRDKRIEWLKLENDTKPTSIAETLTSKLGKA